MKMYSKAEAKYQNFPHQHKRCRDCTMFIPPSACDTVEGDISVHGYCQFFKHKRDWYGTEEAEGKPGG